MDGRTPAEYLSDAAAYGCFTAGGAFMTTWMSAVTKIHYDNNDMSAEAYVSLIIGTVAFCGTVVALGKTAQSLFNAAAVVLPELHLPTLSTFNNLTSYFKRQIVTPAEEVKLVIVTSPPPIKTNDEKSANDDDDDEEVYTLFGMSQLPRR